MGKITLEFDTNEEAEDIRTALDGYKYKLVLWDLDQYLRAEVKYNEKLSPEVYEYYDKLREKMRELLFDYNISIE
jgi:hypothetical protein